MVHLRGEEHGARVELEEEEEEGWEVGYTFSKSKLISALKSKFGLTSAWNLLS